mgnify:CR=1 FL=1|jgi:hypothetical protein
MSVPARWHLGGLLIASILSLDLLAGGADAAPVLFFDDFDSGASPAWGNESGVWRDTDGLYDATFPDNGPPAYSGVTTLPGLTDFAIDVDVNSLDDGGVWLRSSYNGGNISGVLLVTGGFGGSFSGLYWHTVVNGSASGVLGMAGSAGLQGADIELRVEVVGDTYEAFINGSATPLTTLTTALFSSGGAGLYDFSPTSGASAPRGQTFDNFRITDLSVQAPEPATVGLFGLALLGLGAARRRHPKRN